MLRTDSAWGSRDNRDKIGNVGSVSDKIWSLPREDRGRTVRCAKLTNTESGRIADSKRDLERKGIR